MRSCVITEPSLDKIELVSSNEPLLNGSRDVKVKVKACSLNYRDLMVARGEYASKKNPFKPFVPLSDFAGEVEEIGTDVTEFKVGDKVLNAPFLNWPAGKFGAKAARSFVGALGINGVLSEKVIYPADSLFKMPSYLDYIEASTLPVAGLTSWAAIVSFGAVRPGEWVLLEGTGGVSLFAAQLAKALGAKTIVTTSRPNEFAPLQKRIGIDVVLDYRDPSWLKQVKEATGGEGVDLVVEVVGGDSFGEILSLCNYGARIAVIGVLGGAFARFKVADLLFHQITMKGLVVESAEEMKSFLKALSHLQIKPVLDKVFPFEEASHAFHYFESHKHMGKVVIKIN